ncbi:MAG: glycoside hydrolase family 3 N-terminal domain-containing protein [Sciscionella sp.]
MKRIRMSTRWLTATVVSLVVATVFALGTPVRQASGEALQSGLSPRQLAGQRVIYSYPGRTPPASLLNEIRAGRAAGVIFFGENISSASQIAGVIRKLRQANQQSPVKAPLLLMTDQEGGKVRRLPGAPVHSAKQVGQSANAVALAAATGTAAAHNLSGVGMNTNLAPVLGVYRQPGDFLDASQRSYGMHALRVAPLGKAFITAQQKAGVAATAKHFPGLGAAPASANTDLGPVTLHLPLSTLRGVDEAPYSAAITAGVKLVMLSWAIYPALDAHRPAGLSPTIIDNELRGRLGFHGVTVTDALEAGALRPFGSDARRGMLAARAGMDLLLCSARDISQGRNVVNGLAGALGRGQLNSASFLAAVHRVTALRAGLH